MFIRTYRPGDLAALCRLTVEAFAGVSLDQNLEARWGPINGQDWRWRKARQIEDDVAVNPEGVFVAEEDGVVVGYVTTRVDQPAGIGQIPNLAVAADQRNQGLGRRLIERALAYFRDLGLTHARIETLEQNPVGRYLYPACGFEEFGRQIHFALDLRQRPDGDPRV
jgi:ribosomal protein S18 acetylase RimI-like enzyme